jgi:hypothetical protein
MNTKTAEALRTDYLRATKPIIDRLEELRADDEREADGLNRTIPPALAAQERYELRRRFERVEAEAMAGMEAFLAESKARVAAARAQVGDSQQRIADMLEADQLSRQGIDAADLTSRAASRLASGDVRGAQVHLAAAKLAAGGKRVAGLDRIGQAIEAELDKSQPHRIEALAAHRTDRFAFADAAIERTQTRQLVALLASDRPAAARASAAAKLQQFDRAKAAGEPYEQTVEMKRIGEDGPPVEASHQARG